RRRHTRSYGDWSSDVCSSDLKPLRDLVLTGLKDKDAFVQRCAVEALGTHPSPDSLTPLLEIRHTVPAGDTHLLYAVRVALRNQLDRKSTRLNSSHRTNSYADF